MGPYLSFSKYFSILLPFFHICNTMHNLSPIIKTSVRANPGYQLQPLSNSVDPSIFFRPMNCGDRVPYGLLQPCRDARLLPQIICCATALLYFTLRDPGNVPEYLVRQMGIEAYAEVSRLVLDGILQADNNGNWISGLDADFLLPVLPQSNSQPHETETSHLSSSAIGYVQQTAINETSRIATRLYKYNTIPFTSFGLDQLRSSFEMLRSAGLRGQPDQTMRLSGNRMAP